MLHPSLPPIRVASLLAAVTASLLLGCPAPLVTSDSGSTFDAGTHDAGTHDAGTDDAGAEDAGAEDAGSNDAGTDDAGVPDAGPCGAPGLVVSHEVCVAQGPCATDDDCRDDLRCEPSVGCVPWEGAMPAASATCSGPASPGVLTPTLRCAFSEPPLNDPFPSHVDVLGTPMVVEFGGDGGAGVPSIVAVFSETVPGSYIEDRGLIRVLRGDDCTLEVNLGGVDLDGDGVPDWVVAPSSVALGDLDGDGVAEIVAAGADGATLAFTRKAGEWSLLWKVPYVAGAPWAPCNAANHRCPGPAAAPALFDLDGTGPHVLRDGVVFNAAGVLLSMQPTGYASAALGLFPVVANLDADPASEYSNAQGLWEWSAGAWSVEAAFTPGSAAGHAAFADFGAYGTGLAASAPELVVVADNTVSLRATTGEVVLGPIAVPASGGGGPPTVADFDGDGLMEFALASQNAVTVFDPDCGPSPRAGGACTGQQCDFAAGACPAGEGYAWSRAAQDSSSTVTGASAFDFDGDGVAEAISADECFARVFDGKTGEVLLSRARSSCTWSEMPVVADVDGRRRAALVVPSNRACSPQSDGPACVTLDASGADPLFAGQRCATAADCFSGVCDQGLCRCASTAECCGAADVTACTEAGELCAPPPAGTPGSGNTCRSGHPHGFSGVQVYAGARDQWARARPVFNQHSYSITNVADDGVVPTWANWAPPWAMPATNGYRLNVAGTSAPLATGDLTAGPARQAGCSAGAATLSAPICNRGADPVERGLSVGFFVGGTAVCQTRTGNVLLPGACLPVTCTWSNPPSTPVDVEVVPNDDGAYRECHRGNNVSTIFSVACPP